MKDIEELKAVMRKQEMTEEELEKISAGSEDELAQMIIDETFSRIGHFINLAAATKAAIENLARTNAYDAYCFLSSFSYHAGNCKEDAWEVFVGNCNRFAIPYTGCTKKY